MVANVPYPAPSLGVSAIETTTTSIAKGGPGTAAAKMRVVAVMTAQQHVSTDQATKQFDDAQAKLQQVIQTARNAADTTATAAAHTSFAAFTDLLIGATAAAVGGALAVQRRLQTTQRVVR